MFGLTGLRLYASLGTALIIVVIFAWAMRLDKLRGDWKNEALDWRKSTGEVTASIGNSIGNPKLKWKDVARQVDLVVTSRDEWKKTAVDQTTIINEMGAETERLKKLNDELRAKANVEIAKRQKAIDKLLSQSLDPGDRENCEAQIAAANAALDLIFEEGI